MSRKQVYNISYAINTDIDEVHHFFQEKLGTLLFYNALARTSEAEHYNVLNLKAMVDHDPRSVIVARDNGQIKGICINRFDDYTIWLSWIMVDNSIGNLRAGVGSAILNKLNESASERDCHKVWCDCRTDNVIGIEFLKKNGYSVLCEIKNHWYRQDFYLMERVMC
ncbi:MAG: GNAT family N-acetyltransferase [Cytophagales bacterium]|jgi:ribosomal protein S18 acetylase RimI-like enzyme|nr:GNAT family N-acetyltransferase [Cytophagales bacterium]